MKNKTIEFFSFLSIFFLLILIITGSVRVIYGDLSLKNYSMYLWINGELGLFLYVIGKIRNFKFNKFEIIILIMALLSILSLTNAIDVYTAVIGKSSRYEGLLVWLTYYIFMLNAMNIKNKKYLYIIVAMISIYMLNNIFYGLFQVGALSPPSLFDIKLMGQASRGFLGNAMNYGSLAGIFYGIILGLFIKTKVGLKKYLLFILLLLANLGIIMSSVMSVFVGIVAINLLCLIGIIVRLVKKKENRYLYLTSFIIGIASFVLVFMIYSNFNPKMKNDLAKLFGEASVTLDTGEIQDNYGTGRIYIWRNTLEKIKTAPITGYGIDNFSRAFNNRLVDKISHGIVDKAHNDYLQKALCEGIIASIVFVGFLLYVFFKGIFKDLSPLYYGLLLAFICYSVTAFFNISVIRVAPVYFIVTGLLIGKISEKKEEEKAN